MILMDRSPETPGQRSLEGLQYLWFFLAAVIGMGAMVGLMPITKALSWLLKNFHDYTY